MVNKKIIERIKKLLFLADSNNVNESESAMLKAQELMAKYKLSMKDITVEEEKNTVVDEVTNFEYTVRTQWKGSLAVVIAENFGCDAYVQFTTKNGRKNKFEICLVGEAENIEVVKVIYEYALKVCNERISKIQKEYKKKGLSTSGIQANYGIGFTNGLKVNYAEQLKKNQEWGLVVIKSEAVVNYIEKKEFVKNNSRAKYRRNEHFENGYSDGKKFNTNKVLA